MCQCPLTLQCVCVCLGQCTSPVHMDLTAAAGEQNVWWVSQWVQQYKHMRACTLTYRFQDFLVRSEQLFEYERDCIRVATTIVWTRLTCLGHRWYSVLFCSSLAIWLAWLRNLRWEEWAVANFGGAAISRSRLMSVNSAKQRDDELYRGGEACFLWQQFLVWWITHFQGSKAVPLNYVQLK